MHIILGVAKTKNPSRGFWGTLKQYGYETDYLKKLWEVVSKSVRAKIQKSFDINEEEVRGYLDSSSGRHLADKILDYGMQKTGADPERGDFQETVNALQRIKPQEYVKVVEQYLGQPKIMKDVKEVIRAFRKDPW